MNISSIGSTPAAAKITSSYDGQIKALMKQKEQLQEQVKKINESDTDEQTKKEYIKVLKKQIEMVAEQIQQITAEKMQQTTKQKTETQQSQGNSAGSNSGTNSLGRSGAAGMNGAAGNASATAYQADLIKADFSLSRANLVNSAKKALDGRGQVLSQEIALDSARGHSVDAKEEALQEIEVKKVKLDGELGARIAEAKRDSSSQTETNTHKTENNGDSVYLDKTKTNGGTESLSSEAADNQSKDTGAELLINGNSPEDRIERKRKLDLRV